MSKKFGKFLVLIVSSVLISCESPNEVIEIADPAPIEIKGYSYTSFWENNFRRGGELASMNDMMQQTGSEWVSICFFEYQTDAESHDIAPNTTGKNPLTGEQWSKSSTLEDIEFAIERAHELGLKVMLKPHVDLYSGKWRAEISPDGLWFSAYTAMMMKYAGIAEKHNVEMISIGVEYIRATQSKYSNSWRELIYKIKEVFSGKLTYSAARGNAGYLNLFRKEFKQITFWDNLDYIGIDYYYPIKGINPGDKNALQIAAAKMSAQAAEIESVAGSFGLKVLLTEVGIQSVEGALKEPWNYELGRASGAVLYYETQEFYYHVILQSFAPQDWCAGFFWWNWDSVPSSYPETNYTVKGKPAAELLKKWYTWDIQLLI